MAKTHEIIYKNDVHANNIRPKNITNGDTVKKIVYSSTDINNNNNNNININGIHKNNNGILDNNNKKRSHLELYSDEINKMRENLNHIMHPEEKVE